MAEPESVEGAFADALGSDDAERLAELAAATDWRSVGDADANALLQLVGAYGASARTSRYRHIVDAMVDAGVRPNLASCALLGLPARARELLGSTPAAVHETDAHGATPLHHAAEAGSLDMVQLFCERGADIDAIDAFGEPPLQKALHAGPWKPAPALDVVERLRSLGARVDFWTLAALGDTEALEAELTQGGTAPDAFDGNGRTALYCAARNNHPGAVGTLLEHGADPNTPCADGQTALSTACLHMLSQECDIEIVRTLLAHGARATLPSSIVLEDLDSIRRFVAADPGVLRGSAHETALGYAIHTWRPRALRCLLELGASPDAEAWGHIERIAKDEALVRELRRIAGP